MNLDPTLLKQLTMFAIGFAAAFLAAASLSFADDVKVLVKDFYPIPSVTGNEAALAAKIAALLCALQGQAAPSSIFFVDGAEQSNESGSASYEHINHANALSAEFDNSGFAIFLTALGRAMLGEPDPEVALLSSDRSTASSSRCRRWASPSSSPRKQAPAATSGCGPA